VPVAKCEGTEHGGDGDVNDVSNFSLFTYFYSSVTVIVQSIFHVYLQLSLQEAVAVSQATKHKRRAGFTCEQITALNEAFQPEIKDGHVRECHIREVLQGSACLSNLFNNFTIKTLADKVRTMGKYYKQLK